MMTEDEKKVVRLRILCDRAASAIEALFCAQEGWSDNGLQVAAANRTAAGVLAAIREDAR